VREVQSKFILFSDFANMRFHVRRFFSLPEESLLADFALMWSFACVDHQVALPIDEVDEGFVAQVARIWPNVEVDSLVDLQVFLSREALGATLDIADEWLLVGVRPEVVFELVLLVEAL
jgi:hypothetical protein